MLRGQRNMNNFGLQSIDDDSSLPMVNVFIQQLQHLLRDRSLLMRNQNHSSPILNHLLSSPPTVSPLLDWPVAWNQSAGDFALDSLANDSIINPDQTMFLPTVQLEYLVNVNRDVPLVYALVMFGYIMPFLLLLTIVFNSLIVIVLSQKHLRTSTNLVLLAMAISDLLTLLFPAPWYFYMYTLGTYLNLPLFSLCFFFFFI